MDWSRRRHCAYGTATLCAPDERPALFTLVLRDPAVLRRLVIEGNPLLLADAYVRGALDVEGDLYGALGLKCHFESISLSWRDRLLLLRDALRLPVHADAHSGPHRGFASRVARRFLLSPLAPQRLRRDFVPL